MTGSRKTLLHCAMLVAVVGTLRPASATTAPADPCSLLTATAVSSAAGTPYNPPRSSVAPRPYANTAQGTDCHYSPKGSGDELLFRIYFDPSAAEATTLFARLKMFFGPPTAVTGVGDEAYFDGRDALHARKGNVRFYLEMGEQHQAWLKTLGSLVAGQI
jgi:hypothetical protein